MTDPTPRSSHPRPARILAVAAALLAVFAACSAPTQTAAPTRTLAVGATLEPQSTNPWDDTSASIPQVLLYNVYETLVKVDSTGGLQPLLAQTWELDATRTQYTFHLNPAAKFASGAPVDAAAVVANIGRLKSDARLTQTLKEQLAVVDSATAIDPTQVRITLTRPSVMWLYDMSSTLGMMVDPANTESLDNHTAGSGPYAVVAHNRGQSVVLKRSETYWGTPPNFDEVTFRYFLDPNAMNAAMLSGELDIISNLQAPDALPQFADASRFTTTVGTTNGEIVLGLNHSTDALADSTVRQALTMAIDRKALLDTVWAGQGTLIGTMDVPTDPWYEDLSNLYPYDPDKAKELLAQSGHDKLTLRLRVPTVPYAVKSAQFVASQLRDIGVTAKVEELDFTRWISEVLTNGDYDMTIVAHVEARDLGKFADPSYYWHNEDDEFASLYRQADQAPPDEATDLMRQAARRLADEAAAIWLFALPNIVVTKDVVSGVPVNATTLSFDLTSIAER